MDPFEVFARLLGLKENQPQLTLTFYDTRNMHAICQKN